MDSAPLLAFLLKMQRSTIFLRDCADEAIIRVFAAVPPCVARVFQDEAALWCALSFPPRHRAITLGFKYLLR
ncbi:hypothetical protein [Gemmobacter denitrificans]|uniref:Uncharacterized protein n=1 Tax=Gemmobacter denitrificans TaxID=3123040 RepID=A0ABU8BYW3_9RHOB